MKHRRNLLLLPLFLLLAGSAAMAQQPTRTEIDMEEEFLPKMAEFAVNYWIPRLNGYKVRIDRSLPTSDLATLDGLRVRWGIFIEESKRAMGDERVERNSRRHHTYSEPVEAVEAIPVESDGIGVASADEMDNEPATEFATIEELPAPDRSASSSASASATVGGTVTPAPVEYTPAPRDENSPEMLFESAQQLAGRNRSQMDVIHDLIIADLNEFFDKGVEMVDRFVEENRSRMSSDDLRNWAEAREGIRMPETRKTIIDEFEKLYAVGGESFVMLYNGEDVFRLLGLAIPATSSVPLSDMNFEQTSMLAQNAPNPANASTRISYTLRESSDRTSIEIFDAKGTSVMTLDQGARATGDHSVMVDLSKLSPGTYLYRLTVQTAHGEQVSSRVMQVMR